MPGPRFEFQAEDVVMYRMLVGEPLTCEVLLRQDEAVQDRLAEQLALFLSQLHAIPREVVEQRAIGVSEAVRSLGEWSALFADVQRELFPYKTVPELAGQMVAVVRRWFPAVPIKLIGDETYSGLTLGLTCAKYHVTLIAPLRQGACLCAPAPARQPTQNGRPRIKGKRLPKLSQVLADPQTVWQRSNVKWYDGSTQAVEWCSGTALWYRAGQLPLPIR